MTVRNLLYTASILLLACSLQAQTAKESFKAMPDSLAPLLTEVNRADFIDFLESNMRAQVTNRLGGKSEMTRLTPDYIAIRMTEKSTWQMKMLQLNDSTRVICTIFTVTAPAADSRIRFYSTRWEALPLASFLPQMPVMSDFLPTTMPEFSAETDTIGTIRLNEARHQANLLLLKADLSPDANTLTCTFDTPAYMDKEAAELIKPYLSAPVVYTWQEGMFKKQ